MSKRKHVAISVELLGPVTQLAGIEKYYGILSCFQEIVLELFGGPFRVIRKLTAIHLLKAFTLFCRAFLKIPVEKRLDNKAVQVVGMYRVSRSRFR